MKQAKSLLVFVLFSALPYLLLVGSLTVLFDGNARTFWRSLVTILAIRLLFALLDTAGFSSGENYMRGGLRARMACNGIISPALGPAATGYQKTEFAPSQYTSM
jgi:hypothetical protein